MNIWKEIKKCPDMAAAYYYGIFAWTLLFFTGDYYSAMLFTFLFSVGMFMESLTQKFIYVKYLSEFFSDKKEGGI